jgi:hypothetical protein
MSVKKSLVRNFIRYHVVFACSRFSLFTLLARLSRGVLDEKSLKKVEFLSWIIKRKEPALECHFHAALTTVWPAATGAGSTNTSWTT